MLFRLWSILEVYPAELAPIDKLLSATFGAKWEDVKAEGVRVNNTVLHANLILTAFIAIPLTQAIFAVFGKFIQERILEIIFALFLNFSGFTDLKS